MKQTRLNSALLPKRKYLVRHQKTHRLMSIQLLMTLMALPLVSGCSMMSVYEGGFNCESSRGVGCKSISEVNEMMNQGQLPPQTDTDAETQNQDQDQDTNQKTCHSCQTQPVKPDESEEGGIWWSNPLWVEASSQIPQHAHEAA